MNHNSNTYLEINFNNDQDYDNLRNILENNFSDLNLKTRKKLLIIATELIQNNIIHNNSKPCFIKIIKKTDHLILEITQETDKDKLGTITDKISSINNWSTKKLKEIYRKNITDSLDKRVGNGLILCRIKSENLIEIKSEELSNRKAFKLKILIKLNHYE
ncbi:MAG: DUF6272 family protein [Bacteroidales bacterium]|nr:DUF6272 family protein [Bacteroidales bacterium]